MTSQNRN